MALYDRLIGNDDAGAPVEAKIQAHGFAALMRLFGRGRITGAEAQAAISSISHSASGVPTGLNAAEVVEINTLLGTITALTNANAITQRLLRMERAHEIDDMVLLGESGATGFATPTQLKSRLGV